MQFLPSFNVLSSPRHGAASPKKHTNAGEKRPKKVTKDDGNEKLLFTSPETGVIWKFDNVLSSKIHDLQYWTRRLFSLEFAIEKQESYVMERSPFSRENEKNLVCPRGYPVVCSTDVLRIKPSAGAVNSWERDVKNQMKYEDLFIQREKVVERKFPRCLYTFVVETVGSSGVRNISIFGSEDEETRTEWIDMLTCARGLFSDVPEPPQQFALESDNDVDSDEQLSVSGYRV